MYSFFNRKKFICSAAILIVCIVGDKNSTPQRDVDLAAAICDNMAHAFVGILTWFGVLALESPVTSSTFYTQILVCGFFSSVIDLDHFLSAKSLRLKDAVHLRNRPLFHCTTGALFVSSVVLLSAIKLQISWLYRFGWILVAAVLSHHIRDSTRRGFWLWPLGSTKPVPYIAYLLLEAILPDVIYLLFSLASVGSHRAYEQNVVTTV